MVKYDLVTHISVSRDGTCWSTPRQGHGVNYWMWRLLAADGAYRCAAYHFGRRDDRDMRIVHLLRSDDLFDWRVLMQMRPGGDRVNPCSMHPSPAC